MIHRADPFSAGDAHGLYHHTAGVSLALEADKCFLGGWVLVGVELSILCDDLGGLDSAFSSHGSVWFGL